MKATNKQEFFELLEIELNRIGIEDTAEIFADFEDHFADSAMRGIPEDQTAERLGDIKEIARSYLNLESSRINSIMARDIERRKVSLTKPGRDEPADLSLRNGLNNDEQVSDTIREYTPQHFSEEIYPGGSSNATDGNSSGGTSGSSSNSADGKASENNSGGSANGEGTANKSVGEAFSEAGKAALDAAKITGQAVADAFKQSGVKEAVVGAGKTAADAVKAAGQSAADAFQNAKSKHTAKNHGVPHPTDSYRENMNTTGTAHEDSFRANNNDSHTAEAPKQKNKGKPGSKFVDVKGLKPNINASKLVIAILLDMFLWCWLLPCLFGGLISFGLGLGGYLANGFFTAFVDGSYYMITRVFLALMRGSGAVMVVCVAIWLFKLLLSLVRFIINMHIKAIYDL